MAGLSSLTVDHSPLVATRASETLRRVTVR